MGADDACVGGLAPKNERMLPDDSTCFLPAVGWLAGLLELTFAASRLRFLLRLPVDASAAGLTEAD